ncbi:MAG: ferritin [Desulfomonilaceae bacterium]
MISQKIQDAFNEQVNAETYSAYLYLSMASYFASINLNGFATWMKVQAQEELLHAMKFFDYINERGGTVNLKPIDGPPTRWDSPIAAFQEAYRHEQKVTGLINNLVDISLQARDHASNAFLQWFVTEQVEEEASADAVVQKLKLTGDHGGGLFMIDRELGARVFAYPATTTQE